MPKLIDHEHRREEIAEAVWRVILREGVGAVSVRTVAAEANLAVGSVRHVFPSKKELLEFSMALVHARARERVARHTGLHDPRELAEAILHELLPLDGTRRAEMELEVAIIAETPAHPGLRAIQEEAHRGVRAACHGVLRHLLDRGRVRPDADLDAETLRLHALLDGLALHALTSEGGPEAVAERTTGVLRAHLDSLRPPG
jgi:AcrR family transcriptional regulator